MYMVNNQTKRELRSLPFCFFIFLMCFSSSVCGQNINKYYTSSIQESGTLYFIELKQEFENKIKRSKFSYDLTYLTSKDSISLNFTYSDKTIRGIDSISFVQNNNRISSKAEKIFIETDKKLWNHRYSTKFLVKDMHTVFQQSLKPIILVHYGNESMQLDVKNNKWRKQSEIMLKILTLIEANIKTP